MKPQSQSYCKGCIFFYGKYQLVCSVHPYGPEESSYCTDFIAKSEQPNQSTLAQNSFAIPAKRFLLKLLVFCSFSLMLWLGKTSSSLFPLKPSVPVNSNNNDHPIQNSPDFQQPASPESLSGLGI
jgi:hypothetical protein